MRFSTLAASILAATGLVSAQTSGSAAVLNQISLIGNYTAFLNSDVNQFNSTLTSLPWALQVQQDAVLIYRAVNQATYLCNQSPNFGEPGALNVALSLLNLSSTVQKALTNLQGKASTFGELSPIVLQSLYSLKNATDTFASAAEAKFTAIENTIAPTVVKGLDNSFNQAIVAYGGQAR